jgi:hypothetical protein
VAPIRARVVDPKFSAVVACVNGLLDSNNHGWTDENVMGGDLPAAYTSITMPGFLSRVKQCLSPHYTLNDIASLVTPCLAATVAKARLLIYGKTA